MKAQPFPWREAMGFGFATLRLSPDAFWAMTPRELTAAIRFVSGHRDAAPQRSALEALIAAFPDKQTEPESPDGQP